MEKFYDVIPYKYRTKKDVVFQTNIEPMAGVRVPYLCLYGKGALVDPGLLRISSGYAWDGPSGPTVDTESTMEASLVHDALYQLMRDGHLPIVWRKRADKELFRLMRENGAGWFRAMYFYLGVRFCGAKHAAPKQSEK